jgi:hypothetical protein
MRHRPHVLCLVTVSLFPLSASAQSQDPVGAAIGLANGMFGNAPAGTSTASGNGTSPVATRSRSRARRPAANPAGAPLAANAPRQILLTTADGYMNLPLETFQATRRLQPPPFDWSSDGCSFGELSGPFRESFNRACDRHSFGYRNYGGTGLALDRTEARRARIDDRLRDDLNGVCRGLHAGLMETPCLAAAQTVYAAARAQGSSWFMNGTGRPPSVPTPVVPGFNTGANQSPVPGVPLPGAGEGNNGLPVPLPGAGGGNHPAQVLTAPAQVLSGSR